MSEAGLWQQRLTRLGAAAGALALAVATGLSAYAAHGVSGDDQVRAYTAAAMLAVHGLGLLALPRVASGWLWSAVRIGLLLGLLLFVGSLLTAVFFGWRAWLAPAGGSLLILSWLLATIALLRVAK